MLAERSIVSLVRRFTEVSIFLLVTLLVLRNLGVDVWSKRSVSTIVMENLPYTLVRGPVVGWYPYPFLDPRERGYLHVAVSSIIVCAAFLAVAALLCWAGTLLSLRRSAPPSGAVKPAHSQR